MKILVFNGSPKRENSDTLHITNAFLEGMKEASDQEIRLIHVVDKHIEYCMGCFACKFNGGNCIHDDDMREILEEIINSDLLVFSFPLYCYSMPAPLKTLLFPIALFNEHRKQMRFGIRCSNPAHGCRLRRGSISRQL